eukprot:1412886-Pyramimonas_sp.AAC.1
MSKLQQVMHDVPRGVQRGPIPRRSADFVARAALTRVSILEHRRSLRAALDVPTARRGERVNCGGHSATWKYTCILIPPGASAAAKAPHRWQGGRRTPRGATRRRPR